MQITCPSCAADYAVPDDKIAGRTVKCARCGEQWTPVPARLVEALAPAEPDLPQPAEAAPEPALREFADPPPEPPRPILQPSGPTMAPFMAAPSLPMPVPRPEAPARDTALLAAWVASFVVIGSCLVGGLALRHSVMEAWPPSQRLYAVFGLR